MCLRSYLKPGTRDGCRLPRCHNIGRPLPEFLDLWPCPVGSSLFDVSPDDSASFLNPILRIVNIQKKRSLLNVAKKFPAVDHAFVWVCLIPLVPHKAVTEVSKTGNCIRRGQLLQCMDGRANPLMDRQVAESLSLSLSLSLSFFPPLSFYLSLSLSPSLSPSFSRIQFGVASYNRNLYNHRNNHSNSHNAHPIVVQVLDKVLTPELEKLSPPGWFLLPSKPR